MTHPARCLALLWLVCAADAHAAAERFKDVLYMRKGEEHVGRLQRIGPRQVVFVNAAGQRVTYDRAAVQRIELGKARPGDQWRTTRDIDDPLLRRVLKSAPPASAYPTSGSVTLYWEITARLRGDGSSSLTRRRIQKVLQERGKAAANKAIYYLSERSAASIDFGRTITPRGAVAPLLDSAIQDGSAYVEFPEYQNLRRRQAALPEAKPGAVIDFQTTVRTRAATFLRPFLVDALFADAEPAREKVVRIVVPKDLPCRWKLLRGSDIAGEMRALPDGSHEYRWVVKNTPELVRENFMPPRADLWPRLVFAPEAKWEDLARRYARRLAALMKPGPALKKQVAALAASETTPLGRARAVYRYLVREVRTIPVSFVNYHMIPRDVNAVFRRKYGNDLEKTLLAAAMWREAGLPANLCLARPQGAGALVRETPSLAQLTACLARVQAGKQTLFCVVTDPDRPIESLPGALQGVGRLVIDERRPELADTPLAPAQEECVRQEFVVAVDENGVFDVRQTTRYFGGPAVSTRRLRYLKQAELKRRFQQRVAGIAPNAELISFQTSDLNDLAAPVWVKLHYRLADYAVRAGDQLMVFHLPGLNYNAAGVGKPDRVHPLRWTTRWLSAHRYVVTLPKGMRVRYAPAPARVDQGPLRYRARFTRRAGRIEFEDEARRDAVRAPASAYAAYKAGVETMARLAKEWIVVER